MKHARETSQVVRRFVEDAGNLSSSLGLGRAVGQVYAHLYFSPQPGSLADLQTALGISKGSASTVVRQLEQWGAVRKVWVKGDRKDYYEANDWFGRIIKNALTDIVGKKLASGNTLFAEADEGLPADNGSEAAFVRERVQHLRRFQERAQQIWNSAIVQRLLK